MTKNYRARISFDLTGSSKREYRRIVDVVSDCLFARPETAGSILTGSQNDRSIYLVMRIEAASKSTASSKVDTVIRRMIYAIDPNSGVRTRTHTPKISENQVQRELALV